MNKYIIKFAKDDKVKYVSHLDIVRVFERAMRRAGIKLSYSNGFNPHPQMSFAHPLGVGISSTCELMEISLEDDISPKDLAFRLNDAFPQGFKVFAAKITFEKSPFKALTYAEYNISLKGSFQNNITSIMDNEQIIMPKRTKSGTKDTNIKPLILKLESSNNEDITAVLSCGGENLKPDLLIEAIIKFTGAEIDDYTILRTNLFDENYEELIKF